MNYELLAVFGTQTHHGGHGTRRLDGISQRRKVPRMVNGSTDLSQISRIREKL